MPPIPKKYQPRGFEILYEDKDIIVGNKAAGVLTVAAKYDRVHTVHQALNQYVRKGNARSRKCVYVVHRLDRETSGVMVFAKSEIMKEVLKSQWPVTRKTYYVVVHGRLVRKQGTISSYLQEDDEYVMHSSADSSKGKWAQTDYTVLKEAAKRTLLEVTLVTGRKNQIRIHLAELKHPVVGDTKYGPDLPRYPRLALHARTLSFPHPFNGKPVSFEAPVPEYFKDLVGLC